MNRTIAVVSFSVAAFALSYLGQRTFHTPQREAIAGNNPQTRHVRIVSLAPSITEVLFALGLGERVVGVTNRCDYPPEALTKREVGGYYDLNYEAVAALDPDLIVLLPAHREAHRHFSAQGYEILVVNHSTIDGIQESIRTVGQVGGASGRAEELVRNIRRRILTIERKARNFQRPRVMIAVGRDVGSDRMEEICVVGKDGLYDQMITLAGGVNTFEGKLPFPLISTEGIVSMNPDVIIDLIGDMNEGHFDRSAVVAQWDAVPQVSAVENNRVHVFDEEYITVPGPRFVQVLEKMARVLHPELHGN